MARVAITRRALANFERLFVSIAREQPASERRQVEGVHRALMLLSEHPLLGRPVEAGGRELVLS